MGVSYAHGGRSAERVSRTLDGHSPPPADGSARGQSSDSLCRPGDGKSSVTSVFEHRWPSGKAGEADSNSPSHASHWLSAAHTIKFKLHSLLPTLIYQIPTFMSRDSPAGLQLRPSQSNLAPHGHAWRFPVSISSYVPFVPG